MCSRIAKPARFRLLLLIFLPGLFAIPAELAIAQQPDAAEAEAKAATVADPNIPPDELKLLLKPMTKDELETEAKAWMGRLKDKVAEISESELRSKQLARGAAPTLPGEPTTSAPTTQEAADQRVTLLEEVSLLREQRTQVIDRLDVVLEELELKGGDPAPYQQYITAVTGLTLDVTDTTATWTAIRGWLLSKEGGLRWAKNIAWAIAMLVLFWILAKIVGSATRRALMRMSNLSDLLRNFLAGTVDRIVLFAGLLVAVSMLEVKLGPVLAIIGAAGFVVAFALQGTLSNFASGLMILAYRPFDVGDAISAAGVSGSVESMNLVSTTIKSWDNQHIVVPNNSIWGGVITNITGKPIRRVDMTFGISYSDDIGKAIEVMEKILKEHPLVLADPPTTVKLHELGDSSLNFVCRPWVKTADYWTVYWDVTRAVKERFDAAGISIPFPQRDVHVHTTGSAPA